MAPTTERATMASLLRTSIGDRFGLELVDTRKYSKTISLIASVKLHYSRLSLNSFNSSLNGHLYKTDTSVKRTFRVGHCLSLLPLFDSL